MFAFLPFLLLRAVITFYCTSVWGDALRKRWLGSSLFVVAPLLKFDFGTGILHAAPALFNRHGGMAVFYVIQAKATAKTKRSLRWKDVPLL